MPYLLLCFIIDGVAAIATQNTNPCGINKDSSILFYSILVTMCNNHTAKHQQKNVIAEEKKNKNNSLQYFQPIPTLRIRSILLFVLFFFSLVCHRYSILSGCSATQQQSRGSTGTNKEEVTHKGGRNLLALR